MAQDFFRYDGTEQTAGSGSTILAGLSDEDWDKLIFFAAKRNYASGATIVKAHEQTRAIFFIISGRVRIERAEPLGSQQSSETLQEGNVFGILPFLDGGLLFANAYAEGPARLLMINQEIFDQLSAWEPRIAIALLRDIAVNICVRLRQHEIGI